MTPTLKGIDHVHIYVADRQAAVNWYADVMAMEPIEAFLAWAEGGGPLTLSDPTDTIHLAIFERESFTPSNNVAFGATGFNGWTGKRIWSPKVSTLGLMTTTWPIRSISVTPMKTSMKSRHMSRRWCGRA